MFSIGSNVTKRNLSLIKSITKEEFVELLEKNKISLYRIGKSILKNDTEVEDAIGEAILKAYKNKNRLKNIESFKPLIIKILVNECYRIIKKSNRLELVDDLEKLNITSWDNTHIELKEVVNTLGYKFASVITLFYYEDMSIKEISKILKISEGTVKSRLSRAKGKLKEILDREE